MWIITFWCLYSVLGFWFSRVFFFHFLKIKHTCTLRILKDPSVKLDPTKDPLGCSKLSDISFFSLDILEVLLNSLDPSDLESKEKRKRKPWFSSPGYHICFDMWVWYAFQAMTVQIQSWVSTGHSIAMSRLLRQGILLSYVQVIHIQMLDSGVIATSCFTL